MPWGRSLVMGKWYNVDLLQHTCSCGHPQSNEAPRGHATAATRAVEHGAPRYFTPHNPTVPPLRAAYAVPVAPVEISGLEVRYANLNPADGDAGVAPERPPLCRAPYFKKDTKELVNKEHVLPTWWRCPGA